MTSEKSMAAATLKVSPAIPDAREETFKRWLVVLSAFIAFLVAVTTFLNTNASVQSAQYSRRARVNDIGSTSTRTRGQQEVAFAEFVVHREFEELAAKAIRLYESGDYVGARAYVTATGEVRKLSPLLAPPYYDSREKGKRAFDVSRYEADTWVVTSTLLSERAETAAKQANAWSGKNNNYTVSIVVFAVTLFLFALAMALGSYIRWMFLCLGLGLAEIVSLWVLITVLSPVHHIPDMALIDFAQGYGYAWQGKFDQAIRLYSQAIETDREYANAYSERGLARLDVQPLEVQMAIQDLETARRLADDRYALYWNLGWAYYLAGDYGKSIPMSQRALDLNSRICKPSFNIALARLAQGKTIETERGYEAAIALCEKILKDSLAAGQSAPVSLWRETRDAVSDVEDLLCQTHHRYCYENRAKPDVKNVAKRDTVLALGEKYLKRIKEASTALEFQNTATVKPTSANFTPLSFGNKFYNEDSQLQSYVARDRFPYQGSSIYALWNYSGVDSTIKPVWKVFLNRQEIEGLRYVGDWSLRASGSAEKKIDSVFVLQSGHYNVEVYGNGELLSTGSFEIDPSTTLTITSPSNVNPSAPVRVGQLLFSDDFANNNHGWWSGTHDQNGNILQEGKIISGEYQLVTRALDGFWRVTCEACGNLGDFYYEANTRYVHGPTDWGYGITFRGTRGMNQQYVFSINRNGWYTIAKVVDKKYATLVDWTSHPAILPETNRLGILARGDSLEFFINGRSVKQLSDAALSNGYVGLSVERNDLEVAFSQVRVWQVR